jgi:hypothetical protein
LGLHDGDDAGGAYEVWLVGLSIASVKNRQVEHQCLLKPRCRGIDQHAFGDTISVV